MSLTPNPRNPDPAGDTVEIRSGVLDTISRTGIASPGPTTRLPEPTIGHAGAGEKQTSDLGLAHPVWQPHRPSFPFGYVARWFSPASYNPVLKALDAFESRDTKFGEQRKADNFAGHHTAANIMALLGGIVSISGTVIEAAGTTLYKGKSLLEMDSSFPAVLAAVGLPILVAGEVYRRSNLKSWVTYARDYLTENILPRF